MSKGTLPVDGDKLKKIIGKIGTLSAVSASLGYNPNHLSQIASRGQITPITVKLLESVLNIPYEAYAPKQEQLKMDTVTLEDIAARLDRIEAILNARRNEANGN